MTAKYAPSEPLHSDAQCLTPSGANGLSGANAWKALHCSCARVHRADPSESALAGSSRATALSRAAAACDSLMILMPIGRETE